MRKRREPGTNEVEMEEQEEEAMQLVEETRVGYENEEVKLRNCRIWRGEQENEGGMRWKGQ